MEIGFPFFKIDSSEISLSKYFNLFASLRAFKFDIIHPHADEYNWNEADSLVAFAKKSNSLLHAHTLLWDAHIPYWIIWDSSGKLIHRKELDRRLKNHIQCVVGRYKGTIHSWDVVNEALYDNDKEFYKPSWWYKIMGEDYIFNSFKYAHETDTTTNLYYNDYGLEWPDKRNKLIKLISRFRERNIPIHGIGIQGHWNIKELDWEQLEKSIIDFSALGLDVRISELSFSGYRSEKEMFQAYQRLFALAEKHKDKVNAVVLWRSENKTNPYKPLLDMNGKPDTLLRWISSGNVAHD